MSWTACEPAVATCISSELRHDYMTTDTHCDPGAGQCSITMVRLSDCSHYNVKHLHNGSTTLELDGGLTIPQIGIKY